MANKTSKNREAYYSTYKSGNKQAKNRKIKLERLLKEQPNNKQIEQALKDVHYRRHTPKEPFWSHSGIALAKIIKEFTGHFDRNILNSNPKVAAEAMSSLPTVNADFKLDPKVEQSISNKRMFSLKARIKVNGQYAFAGSTTLAGLHQ